MFVLACPSASSLGFKKDAKMKHIQLTHSSQFHVAPSAMTQFWHKVFEEDVGRVKVSVLIVLPLDFNTIWLVYAHILLKPHISAHITPAPSHLAVIAAPPTLATADAVPLAHTPQPQPPPRPAPTMPTHFQQAPVPSTHVRYTPTSADTTQTLTNGSKEKENGAVGKRKWTNGQKAGRNGEVGSRKQFAGNSLQDTEVLSTTGAPFTHATSPALILAHPSFTPPSPSLAPRLAWTMQPMLPPSTTALTSPFTTASISMCPTPSAHVCVPLATPIPLAPPIHRQHTPSLSVQPNDTLASANDEVM
ncbi:uncharacterized protein F5891DRAFT_977776 [Suillus fuscotomentosus]|uniref:Uncharacterized protein n=1 Tax=Suillus fuscotomentosus TaxID=1912939 RepID=A0AAD4ECM8_9AGAM|nr:uncharacterized protein F5891DRAFT_977776 [Suillus fuscotomentosus]KAG1903680.1 hypothetical protein F5891DRAFT_977776 [Suillus fuscotomentosus]